jgi:hypothetical protein
LQSQWQAIDFAAATTTATSTANANANALATTTANAHIASTTTNAATTTNNAITITTATAIALTLAFLKATAAPRVHSPIHPPQNVPQHHLFLSRFPYIGGPNLADCRLITSYHTHHER